MSFHGASWVFMLNTPRLQLGELTRCTAEAAAKARVSRMYGSRSTSPARMASARLVSLEYSLTVMCLIGTVPPHQCGLAVSSAPVVGSKLVTCQGPVPMVRVPGLPNVPWWARANFFSKIPGLLAGVSCQLASGWLRVTVTVSGLVAVTLFTLANPRPASEPGAR